MEIFLRELFSSVRELDIPHRPPPGFMDISKTAGEHRAAHNGAHRLVSCGIIGILP